ncbi:hypothetical protein CB0940_00296 [Cercospora beticola]|uniref:Clr5 domain-containing protein n=1 Tax=Cercospora beticola TaxID=122368 RepID=A0A2G5IAH5_CERBT|nr:hypothetical protein CB0940_00296 [Cercospora beticola]PIB01781.1 hypothetical protein CB0940_00296 [Cercospora beticola]WPA95706.1 hypothetical protein RHO25_000309 [Cercospora beticola]
MAATTPATKESRRGFAIDYGDNAEFYYATLLNFEEPDAKYGYKHPGYPHKSDATPPGCMTKCITCAGQWVGPVRTAVMPYERSFTDEEAAKRITDLKTNTSNNLNYTRTFLDKHGNTIVNSWKKRSPDQRKDIIRRTMPDIAPRKGFLMDKMYRMWKMSRNTTRRSIPTFATKYHKGLLLSYLDAETLSQKASDLLALLYQRTRFKPAEWASFDSLQLECFFRAPYMRTAYNPHCVQMYGGQFGQLVSWEKEAAHRLDIVGFPRAFLIFQAQHELSILLREFVDSLGLSAIPPAIRGRGELDTLTSNAFKNELGWTDKNGRTNPHCLPPPKLDLEGLADGFWARYKAAVDELWLMQIDPAYLREYVGRCEGALLFKGSTPDEVQGCKAQIALMPLTAWESWRRLHLESERILLLLKEPGGPVKVGKPLPEKYEVALAGLERSLVEEFSGQCSCLMTLILYSETFGQHCEFLPGRRITYDTQMNNFVSDPLAHHLMELAAYEERLSYPAAYHLRMLEQIMDNSKDQAARIDPLLLSALSSMTAIDDALTTIRSHRPRHRPIEQLKDSSHWEGYEACRIMFKAFRDLQRENLEPLFAPLEDLLRVPRQSRSINRRALHIFDESHKMLQLFWSAVRRRWWTGQWKQLAECGVERLEILADGSLSIVSLSVTDDYRDGVMAERATLIRAIKAQESKATASARAAAVARLTTSDTPPQEIWGQETAEIFRPPAEKVKPKTRPLQPAPRDPNEGDGEVTEAAQALDNLALRIQVDKAAYDIFQQMYDARSDHQCDTRWEDFIKAMIDAGFSVKPSGGSVFTCKDSASEGSINFHRPHPDPSVDPVMLRIMGKRLNKWFKFDKDTFVVRQKQEA